MNVKAFNIGYMADKEAAMGSAAAKRVVEHLPIAALLGGGAGGAAGIAHSLASSPTKTGIQNEVKKIELAEIQSLKNRLEAMKQHKQDKDEAGLSGSKKTIHI